MNIEQSTEYWLKAGLARLDLYRNARPKPRYQSEFISPKVKFNLITDKDGITYSNLIDK